MAILNRFKSAVNKRDLVGENQVIVQACDVAKGKDSAWLLGPRLSSLLDEYVIYQS